MFSAILCHNLQPYSHIDTQRFVFYLASWDVSSCFCFHWIHTVQKSFKSGKKRRRNIDPHQRSINPCQSYESHESESKAFAFDTQVAAEFYLNILELVRQHGWDLTYSDNSCKSFEFLGEIYELWVLSQVFPSKSKRTTLHFCMPLHKVARGSAGLCAEQRWALWKVESLSLAYIQNPAVERNWTKLQTSMERLEKIGVELQGYESELWRKATQP